MGFSASQEPLYAYLSRDSSHPNPSPLPDTTLSGRTPTNPKTFLLTWRRDSRTTLIAVDNGATKPESPAQFGCGVSARGGAGPQPWGGVDSGADTPQSKAWSFAS